MKKRLARIQEKTNIDWATAEALALGSLLYEGKCNISRLEFLELIVLVKMAGYNVRISGQDIGRGTFSHRHAMLVDQSTNNIYIPLNSIHPDQSGYLEVVSMKKIKFH